MTRSPSRVATDFDVSSRTDEDRMDRRIDANSDRILRGAILTWGGISAVAGVALLIVALVTDERWLETLCMSLSSAAISIAGALLITEWILKPLYVRDILNVARLSADVHHSGLEFIGSAQDVNWSKYLSGNHPVEMAIGTPGLLFNSGVWASLRKAARADQKLVRLHGPSSEFTKDTMHELGEAWRSARCDEKGSKLEILPAPNLSHQGLLIRCGPWLIATVQDEPSNDDPVLLVFSPGDREPITDSLSRFLDRLANVDDVPGGGA